MTWRVPLNVCKLTCIWGGVAQPPCWFACTGEAVQLGHCLVAAATPLPDVFASILTYHPLLSITMHDYPSLVIHNCSPLSCTIDHSNPSLEFLSSPPGSTVFHHRLMACGSDGSMIRAYFPRAGYPAMFPLMWWSNSSRIGELFITHHGLRGSVDVKVLTKSCLSLCFWRFTGYAKAVRFVASPTARMNPPDLQRLLPFLPALCLVILPICRL